MNSELNFNINNMCQHCGVVLSSIGNKNKHIKDERCKIENIEKHKRLLNESDNALIYKNEEIQIEEELLRQQELQKQEKLRIRQEQEKKQMLEEEELTRQQELQKQKEEEELSRQQELQKQKEEEELTRQKQLQKQKEEELTRQQQLQKQKDKNKKFLEKIKNEYEKMEDYKGNINPKEVIAGQMYVFDKKGKIIDYYLSFENRNNKTNFNRLNAFKKNKTSKNKIPLEIN